MARRHCERCKSVIPDRMSRQRDENGLMVCEECKKMKTPEWEKTSMLTESQTKEYRRRSAEALVSILRVDKKIAHDSGDNAVVNHCFACGSGAVTGRSDGSIDCGYCKSVFTVQVQPSHPYTPQTINGTPTAPPGMPAGMETEMSGPDDLALSRIEEESTDPLTGMGDPSAAGMGQEQTPVAAPVDPTGMGVAASRKFFTREGNVLNRDSYLSRLALEHADDRDQVLASIREHNSR